MNLYGLSIEKKDYLFYLIKTKEVGFETWSCGLPQGNYKVIYIDPAEGGIHRVETMENNASTLTLKLPSFSDDLVIRIVDAENR